MHKLSQFSMKPISFLISLLKQNNFLMVAFKASDISYLIIGPIYTRSGLCSKRRFSREEINPG